MDFLWTIDANANSRIVSLKELAPAVIDQHAVGLKIVLQLYITGRNAPNNAKCLGVIVNSEDEGFPSVPQTSNLFPTQPDENRPEKTLSTVSNVIFVLEERFGK